MKKASKIWDGGQRNEDFCCCCFSVTTHVLYIHCRKIAEKPNYKSNQHIMLWAFWCSFPPVLLLPYSHTIHTVIFYIYSIKLHCAYSLETPFSLKNTYRTSVWVRAKSLQSCLTLCDPMDSSLSSFSVHGIFQARILKWAAILTSRGSFRPRDWTRIS